MLLITGAAFVFSTASERRMLPVKPEDWPRPTEEELASVDEPRYFSTSDPDAVLTLTIEAMGIHEAPVLESGSDRDLDRGVIHLPETPMPDDEAEQKNVYLAGHRVGHPETTGRMIFFNLDKIQSGDEVVLKDTAGNLYEYRVTERFTVRPHAEWAIEPVKDRDIVTLQTCTYPNPINRVIVRADRVR